jgi:hypothetical protein
MGISRKRKKRKRHLGYICYASENVSQNTRFLLQDHSKPTLKNRDQLLHRNLEKINLIKKKKKKKKTKKKKKRKQKYKIKIRTGIIPKMRYCNGK